VICKSAHLLHYTGHETVPNVGIASMVARLRAGTPTNRGSTPAGLLSATSTLVLGPSHRPIQLAMEFFPGAEVAGV
jgi:hypothetical protein